MCDVDTSAGLDFAEFVTAAMTYCFFGKTEILKFCFYIFDKDKNGFIEVRFFPSTVLIWYTQNDYAHVNRTTNCKI